MRESAFHQLSDSQCIFLFAFGEVKIICAFVTFSADPNYGIKPGDLGLPMGKKGVVFHKLPPKRFNFKKN